MKTQQQGGKWGSGELLQWQIKGKQDGGKKKGSVRTSLFTQPHPAERGADFLDWEEHNFISSFPGAEPKPQARDARPSGWQWLGPRAGV